MLFIYLYDNNYVLLTTLRHIKQKEWLRGITSIDKDALPIPPTMCTQCTFLYIRTQGVDQEVCLICQRADHNHNYCPKDIIKIKTVVIRRGKLLGSNKNMDVYDEIEEWFSD